MLGRNPVVECLRAGVPATALYVALGTESDERLTESVTRAADSGIPILEVSRTDLDRMSSNGLHQGIGLQVPLYQYAHPADLLREATSDVMPALLVALDNISDPRNLGAIVRSAAAFGGHGVLIPQRRSASVTAVAWLARKVDSFGVRLKAGDVVLPGACMRAIDARPGDGFLAEFTGLGSVRLTFE